MKSGWHLRDYSMESSQMQWFTTANKRINQENGIEWIFQRGPYFINCVGAVLCMENCIAVDWAEFD